jgi:hypothetical protein
LKLVKQPQHIQIELVEGAALLNLNVTAWSGDHLNRQEDGLTVANYLVSRSLARLDSGIQDGFVFAIQGEYGEGKSYFLRNLARQLNQEHPVAFIDAWESDTIGSPYMALLNALDTALQPFLAKDSKSERAGRMIGHTTAILGAVIKGAGKKAAEKYLGEGIGEAVAEITGFPEAKTEDDADDKAGEVGSQAITDGMAQFSNINEVYALGPKATLNELRLHRMAREALVDLKAAMGTIVQNLRVGQDKKAPIFIFVDELDRCSPTYAVAILEEIKHLFGLPGVIFVLGMQPQQLAMSIKGVYGTDFDGSSYLERLIHYRYTLSSSPLDDFITNCLMREPLPEHAFSKDIWDRSIAECVAAVFNYKGLKPRAVERSIEKMRTAAFACQKNGWLDPTYLAVRCCEAETKHSPLAPMRALRGEYVYQESSFTSVKTSLNTGDQDLIRSLPKIAGKNAALVSAMLKNPNTGEAAAALIVRGHRNLFDDGPYNVEQYYSNLLRKVSAFSRGDTIQITGVIASN